MRLRVKGADVCLAQQRLKALGYDVGDLDGYYGYKTQEALERFQRDYGLVVDGIAGDETLKVLCKGDLPVFLGSEEGYQTLPVTNPNTSREAAPFFSSVRYNREVWAITKDNAEARSSLARNGARLSGVLSPIELFDPNPSFTQDVVLLQRPSDLILHKIVSNKGFRKTLFEYLSKLGLKGKGIYFPWDGLLPVEGIRYLKMLRALRKHLDGTHLMVRVSRRLPPPSILGGVCLSTLGDLVDQVVLPVEIPLQSKDFLDEEVVTQAILRIRREIPSWKILLLLPLYSVLWSGTNLELLSYSQGKSIASRFAARQKTDERGQSYYSFKRENTPCELRVVTKKKAEALLELVNRLHLRGVVLDSLGVEDGKIWDLLPQFFGTMTISW